MEGKTVYSENIIMEKLLSFIDRNNSNKTGVPFFLYFPTQLPHGPTSIPEVHKDFKDDTRLTQWDKEYASMVKMLDDDVGRIHKKLQDLNILENTIIVFTSDNGHEVYYPKEGRTTKKETLLGEPFDNVKIRFTSENTGDIFDGNDGMSGKKRDNWEGGTRVPLFWFWKNKIKAGTVSNQMVSNYDFLNTLAEVVGVEEIKEKDGRSYAQTLFGGQSEKRDYTVYSSKFGPAIVTQKGWKVRYVTKKNIFQLYYLPEDYEEVKNLAEKNPEKLETLKTILFEECDRDWNNGYGPRSVKVKM